MWYSTIKKDTFELIRYWAELNKCTIKLSFEEAYLILVRVRLILFVNGKTNWVKANKSIIIVPILI